MSTTRSKPARKEKTALEMLLPQDRPLVSALAALGAVVVINEHTTEARQDKNYKDVDLGLPRVKRVPMPHEFDADYNLFYWYEPVDRMWMTAQSLPEGMGRSLAAVIIDEYNEGEFQLLSFAQRLGATPRQIAELARSAYAGRAKLPALKDQRDSRVSLD